MPNKLGLPSIDAYWKEFQKYAVPREADAATREIIQHSFYAGATSMFGLVVNDLLNSAETAETVLDSVHKELDEFMIGMLATQTACIGTVN